jgi:hypothetical protein
MHIQMNVIKKRKFDEFLFSYNTLLPIYLFSFKDKCFLSFLESWLRNDKSVLTLFVYCTF